MNYEWDQPLETLLKYLCDKMSFLERARMFNLSPGQLIWGSETWREAHRLTHNAASILHGLGRDV